MHTHKHKAAVAVEVGDSFRIDGKRMTVLAIDDSVVWLKDDCGDHYERRVQQIEQCGKYVVQPTDLPGHPIDTMPEDGRYYLVSCAPDAHNPGGQPYVLARLDGCAIVPMFSSGSYCGARLWHPFKLVTGDDRANA